MLTNIIGGLQGMVDHVLVGHLVGFKANAAIGVAVVAVGRDSKGNQCAVRVGVAAVARSEERARGASLRFCDRRDAGGRRHPHALVVSA